MAIKLIHNAKNKSAEILLYEEIGEFWGVSARQFAKEVEELGDDIKHFVLRINSYGGEVFDGVTIYNFLKARKNKLRASLEVHIDGVAASIASVIAMVADKGELHMAGNGWMMIHEPHGVGIGTAADMRKTADLLDGIRDKLLDTYMARASADRKTVSDMIAAETWLTADEALEHGLIDRITDDLQMAASATQRMPQGWFKHPPENFLARNQPPAPSKRAQEIIARTRQSLRKHRAGG